MKATMKIRENNRMRLNLKTRWCVFALTACLALPIAHSLAQQTDEQAPAGATEQVADEGGTSLWGIIRQGGVIMFPLGLLSVIAGGLAIYGGIATQEKKMLPLDLVPSLQENLEKLHVDEAKSICA
ncbi:MAG: hypothetical protein ACOCUY_03065, partial [Verrucomicrobiota bacterium]